LLIVTSNAPFFENFSQAPGELSGWDANQRANAGALEKVRRGSSADGMSILLGQNGRILRLNVQS
jgi:hypothetical protein